MNNFLREIPWRRFWKVGRPFWQSSEKGVAYLYLGSIFGLMIGNIGLQMVNNYLQGKVAKSIQHWDLPNITFYLAASLLLALAMDPVQTYAASFRTTLALYWRRWLSKSFFHRWYDASSKPYFWITTQRKDVANPDQRMTQDPDSYANSTIGLGMAFFEAGFQMVSWAALLLTLSYMLTFGAVICAMVSSAIVIFIGKSLVVLTNQLMDTEAELRVSAGRARDGAEAIAFGQGEAVAKAQAMGKVDNVIDTLLRVMRVNRRIQLFTTAWNQIMPLVPPAIMVYMSPGPIDYEYIVRAGGAFTAFYNAANVFANQFGGLASYFAIINRLGVFSEAIEWAGKEPEPGKRIEVTIGKDIAFTNATILTADSAKVLWANLTFRLGEGDNLLICNNGLERQGKTSLLKTIAGILNNGTGQMERPPSNEVMFLTPNPDLPVGTLREALSYPLTDPRTDDARLQQILSTVNLPTLASRLGGFDTVQNWKETLSKTEQQRLVLARIVFNKPRYVVIDESGLDEENERMLYTTLAALGAIVVSAGNPSTLLRFASKVLEVSPDGSWKLCPASDYKPAPAPSTKEQGG